MICEHCGCKLEENNTYVVVGAFAAIEVQTAHIACKKCAEEIYKDCLDTFSKKLVERCITIKKVEVLPDDLQ